MSKKIKGVMIFYIDVGYLSPDKSETFVKTFKNNYKKKEKKLKKNGIETIFMPIPSKASTHVEFIPTSEKSMKFDTTAFRAENIEIEDN